MQNIAKQVEALEGIAFEIYGFDMGSGLPSPKDYRDLPYLWKAGFYQMDARRLRSKLDKNSELVLGDVRRTVPAFLKRKFAPIGFVSIDLDFYTSTKHALNIFSAKHNQLLPRTFCYFDDVVGGEDDYHCEYVGELLAISEFNQKNKYRKLSKINGLIHKRRIKNFWTEGLYVLHLFQHPEYNTYVKSDIPNQLPLKT